MKKIITLVYLLFCINNAHSQQDTLKDKIIGFFEINCPLYVLEYYCTPGGLEDIVKKAKVDDRVSKIIKIPATNEVEARDSSIEIHYNNSIIIFEKYKTNWNLAPFTIIVKNKIDLEWLGITYAALMGFTKDEDMAPREGLTARYARKGSPMNSILTYEFPKKKFYYASCFTMPYGFCK